MSEGSEENGRNRTSRRVERELVLACARVRPDAETAERIGALIGAGVDWDYLISLARRHLILPLLCHQLSVSASDKIPRQRLHELKAAFRYNAARNLFYAAELSWILKAFDKEGIRAVPFKGPVLALQAYGNLSLRRFADLDILVHRHDLQRAKEVLFTRGYEPRPRLTTAQESLLLRTQHNLQFVRETGRLIVELHWEIVPRNYAYTFRAEDFWGRLERDSLGGVEMLTLAAEDLLLALCVHGTKHLWERLVWVCDVAELLRSQETLDWGEAVARARAAGLERMLLLGVRLAWELLDAPAPDPLKAALADDRLGELSSFVRGRLFDSTEFRRAGAFENIRFNLRARAGWRDRARYCGFIFSPTDGDIAAIRLPAAMSSLYFVVRPFRLLLKGEHDVQR